MPNRPPPPEPYETWLDWVVSYGSKGYAKAELAELRAELERLKRECGLLRGLNNDLIARRAVHNPPDPADEYLRTAKAT